MVKARRKGCNRDDISVISVPEAASRIGATMSGLSEVVPVRVDGTYEILGSDMQILNTDVE